MQKDYSEQALKEKIFFVSTLKAQFGLSRDAKFFINAFSRQSSLETVNCKTTDIIRVVRMLFAVGYGLIG